MSRYVRVGGHVIYPSRWERRASPLPLLVWVFVIAFLASCLTLAFNAAASLVEKPALDVAAVRADAHGRGLGVPESRVEENGHRPHIGALPAPPSAGSARITSDDQPPASESSLTSLPGSQLITPRDDPAAAIVAIIRAAAIERRPEGQPRLTEAEYRKHRNLIRLQQRVINVRVAHSLVGDNRSPDQCDHPEWPQLFGREDQTTIVKYCAACLTVRMRLISETSPLGRATR